ncbi:MAG: SoxR reducing system RseC family protein [Bacillota bacterium]
MNQVGIITEIVDPQRAKILMRRHSACGDCGACQHGKENMEMTLIAMNDIDAKIGDMVEVNLETQNVMGAAFIVYVIPLITLLIAIMGSSFLLRKIGFTKNIDVYAAIIGFIFMAVSFIVIRSFEGSFKNNKKYVPTITKIIE